jgi:hypothetical protein
MLMPIQFYDVERRVFLSFETTRISQWKENIIMEREHHNGKRTS